MSEYGELGDDESVDHEDQKNHADIQLELERLRELEEIQVLINTVKAGYNEPNVPAIFVRYRMSSLYKTYII